MGFTLGAKIHPLLQQRQTGKGVITRATIYSTISSLTITITFSGIGEIRYEIPIRVRLIVRKKAVLTTVRVISYGSANMFATAFGTRITPTDY